MRNRVIDPRQHRVTNHSSVGAFCGSGTTPPGINTILENGVPINLLNVPTEADTTLVMLHGAMEGDVRLPVLSGMGVSRGVVANRVFISDPSLVLSEHLLLSWYAGNHLQPSLQADLAAILQKVVADHGARRVVLFGGSGGGFAALELASRLENALAVVFNPQTRLAHYRSHAVRSFTQHAFRISDYEYDPLALLPRSVTTDLVQRYALPRGAKVAYMQNSRDQSHVQRHLRPFVTQLDPSNDVRVMLKPWSAGHTPPPKDLLAHVLQRMTSDEWDDALGQLGFVPSDALPESVWQAPKEAARSEVGTAQSA